MKMVLSLCFDVRHYEYAELLGDGANYMGRPYREASIRSAETFGIDASKIACKVEKFFKTKLAPHAVMGSEWFEYSDDRMKYIERMFNTLAKSENSAVVRVTLSKH